MGRGFGLGKVRNPQARGAGASPPRIEHLGKKAMKTELNQHGDTAAHGVDAVLLVERHDLLILVGLFRIAEADVLGTCVDDVIWRLERLHLPHRLSCWQGAGEQEWSLMTMVTTTMDSQSCGRKSS